MVNVGGARIFNPDAAAAPPVVPTALEYLYGQWGYRFKLGASATKLDLDPVGPNSIATGTTTQVAAGLTTTFDIAGIDAMNAAGNSTGARVNASLNTIFNVYWATNGTFAGGLAFSTTAPTKAALGNGLYSMPTLGFLFLGWIRTDGSGNLVDTVKDRHIVNYWNRRQRTLELCPNYTDDNTVTTYTRASATWTTLTATAATSQVSFIGNDEALYDVSAVFATQSSAVNPDKFGVGQSTTAPRVTCSASANAGNYRTGSCRDVGIPTFGALTTLSMLTVQEGGSTCTFVADFGRAGAATDPVGTHLRGYVWA